MNSAMNEKKSDWNDKKNDWAEKGKKAFDHAVSDVKNLNPEELRRSATELTTKVRDFSADSYDDAVSYVRSNPVTAALGIAAFGFLIGLFTGISRKSA